MLLRDVALAGLAFCGASAMAQELTPRAYWPAPNGTKVVVLAYQYSSGDVVTDPSLPISGVESGISLAQATYLQTFDLFGRTANVQLGLPYTWGASDGFAEGNFVSGRVSGMADARVRLSVNLLGAPTMDTAGLQALRAQPRTLIGVSLLAQAPTGSYEPDKLLNPGTNRWAVKPAIGSIWPIRPCLAAGARGRGLALR